MTHGCQKVRFGHRRLQCQVARILESRLELLALLLRQLALGDVLPHTDDASRPTFGVTHERHRQTQPALLATLVNEALLDGVVVVVTRGHAAKLLPAGERIVRMHELGKDRASEHVVDAVAHDRRQRGVGGHTPPVHARDRDAERRFLEDGAEASLTLAQRLLDFLALDHECLVDRLLLTQDVGAGFFRKTNGQLTQQAGDARRERGRLVRSEVGAELLAQQSDGAAQHLRRGVAQLRQAAAQGPRRAGVERLAEQHLEGLVGHGLQALAKLARAPRDEALGGEHRRPGLRDSVFAAVEQFA